MAASAGGDRLLERIRRFVERESPSGDEALCATLAAEIALELEAAGAATEQIAAPGCGTH
ncbi:MAG: hypothetical protein HY703_13005, partial [Gemmatimonadetes bacterium]|nr:hypothetical protein [Gemmatimonadota bacterium]